MDSIGTKPVAASDQRPIGPVGGAARAPAPEANRGETAATVASSLAQTARELSSKPPVDAERVARIRAAIADGSFPILPATIADRIIAFKLNWRPDDAA